MLLLQQNNLLGLPQPRPLFLMLLSSPPSTHSIPKTLYYVVNPDRSVEYAGDIASQPSTLLALVSRLVTKHASKVSSANDLTACSSDDNTDPHHPWTMYHPRSTDCSSDDGGKAPQRMEKRCSKHLNPVGTATNPPPPPKKKKPMQRFHSPWSRVKWPGVASPRI